MISFKFKLKILAPVNNFYFQSVFQVGISNEKSFLSGLLIQKKVSFQVLQDVNLILCQVFFGGVLLNL